MKITCIESSSKGNAFLIKRSHDRVLIDCGVKPKAKYDTLVITHLHGDHVKYFENEILTHNFYCAKTLLDELVKKYGSRIVKKYKVMDDIAFFDLNHDVPCFGVVVYDGKESYCHITDTTNDFDRVPYIYGCDYYGVESNYDDILLKQSGRPSFLINRIINEGHLSNTEAFMLVKELSNENLKEVMHFHISTQTNSDLEIEMTHTHLAKEYGDYKKVYARKGESIGKD